MLLEQGSVVAARQEINTATAQANGLWVMKPMAAIPSITRAMMIIVKMEHG